MDAITFNTSSYVAFKNVSLDEAKLEIDSNTNVIKSKANKDTYILDTKTNEITRVAAGEDLSDYLQNVESTGTTVNFAEVKDQYRILAEVDGGTTVQTDYTGTALTNADFGINVSRQKLYDADGNEVSGIALNNYFDENGMYKGGLYADSQATKAIEDDRNSDYDLIDFTVKNTAEAAADLQFSLHVGADSARTNKINANIQAMSAAALGINKLVSTSVGIVDETGDNATDAIDVISAALQKVSTQRSALGAVQNRLEHTIKNLDNVVENTQSAESAIRDTDMAEEMVKYSNANILSQAGQSMLAQANQANQGVLSILG